MSAMRVARWLVVELPLHPDGISVSGLARASEGREAGAFDSREIAEGLRYLKRRDMVEKWEPRGWKRHKGLPYRLTEAGRALAQDRHRSQTVRSSLGE